MPTVFTRIIAGESPGTCVGTDDVCVVFLSINPMAPGHALVVPRLEIDQWTDLPPDVCAHLFEVARIVATAQKESFECERVGLIVAGYEVPHVHVHVIPTASMSQLSFANAASSVARADLDLWASALRSALRRGGHGAAVPV
ncbi:MAG: HIT family protein [Ilumatobacteraceae bacterium]